MNLQPELNEFNMLEPDRNPDSLPMLAVDHDEGDCPCCMCVQLS